MSSSMYQDPRPTLHTAVATASYGENRRLEATAIIALSPTGTIIAPLTGTIIFV